MQRTESVERISRKPVLASIIGTVVEYYDFAVYGYMATVLSTLFFSQGDPSAALLNTLATFAVAFFLRTPGGILFGHIGDRYGRRSALALTILLMCLATLGIGLLPDYSTIGIWATVLLVLMRCLQGIAAGGELGGAVAFLAESAPARKRALTTSLIHLGSLTGALFAALLVLGLNQAFSAQTITDWAWRLPFLVSLPLALVGLWIRTRLAETEQFRTSAKAESEKPPIFEVLAKNPRQLLQIFGLAALVTGGYYVAYVYGATYLETVTGLDRGTSFLSTVITILVSCAVLPLSGMLADRFGRKPAMLLGSILGLALALPAFFLMSSPWLWLAVLGNVLLGVPVDLCLGTVFAVFAELLGTRVRYTGIALGFNLSQMLLGGTAPYLSTWLINSTGQALAPAWFYLACALISLCTALTLRETKGIRLPD